MKTAVEWLLEQYVNKGIITIEDIEQAKEMEREQIIEAFKQGVAYWNGDEWKLIDIEQYYNETFKSE
jgi:hypothetical protein